MRKKDRYEKKLWRRISRHARWFAKYGMPRIAGGWAKYKGSHNQQRMRTNQPYWKAKK